MIDSTFRKLLPKFTRPLISCYEFFNLTPNHVTFLGFSLGILSAFFIIQEKFIVAGLIWWLGRLFDGTDGIYARALEKTSALGAHLDILLDMAAYSAIIIAFYFVYPELGAQWLIVLALYVLCITGALSLGSLMEKAGLDSHNNRGLNLASGLAEGGETGLMYTCMLLLPGWIEILVYLWILILTITILARFILAVRILK